MTVKELCKFLKGEITAGNLTGDELVFTKTIDYEVMGPPGYMEYFYLIDPKIRKAHYKNEWKKALVFE